MSDDETIITELHLNEEGQRILKRGGNEDINADNPDNDDALVIMTIMQMAPGISQSALETCFINLREQYGKDALRALQTGHVQFQKRQ